MSDLLSVVIVDDHDIFRLGLSVILDELPFVKVTGDVSNGSQLFNLLKNHVPDLIFMDINIAGESGIEITKKIKKTYPSVVVIAITASEEISSFKDMIEAGAQGFLLKNVKALELKSAIEEVIQGRMYYSKEFLFLAHPVANSKNRKKTFVELSPRENDTLQLICKGLSNQEIAEKLFISPHTVDAHRRSLLQKTEAKNTAEMIMVAFRDGLVDLSKF